ncbi:MAG: hypothetical protein ACE14L_05905 [Terriglobales bacterium]
MSGASIAKTAPEAAELLRDEQRHIKALVCAETAAACARRFPGRLRALVLTGSMARSEATVVHHDGGHTLLGDADFLAVFDTRAAQPPQEELDAVCTQVEARLGLIGITLHVGVNAVERSYFAALPAHTYTYELRACGQVVMGDERILDSIPDYTLAELSREDAWRTLCHRILEVLAALPAEPHAGDPLAPDVTYAVMKLFLDMATSYLVFAGEYEPTYAGRAKRLEALAAVDANSALPLRELARRVAQCTAWKLNQGAGNGEARWPLVEEAVWFARQLWRWEAKQLTGLADPATVGQLIGSLAAKQNLRHRARGWLSLLRRTGVMPSWRNWPRWARLSLRATPRMLIYRVAAELFFRLPCLVRHQGRPPGLDANWNELARLLPRAPSPPCRGWRELVNSVVANYEEFLMGTTA